MNYENKNPIYSTFPWLEETLKNYQENIDYKVSHINDIKHYEILSEKLKKYLEEEWHQKINPDFYGGLSPLSEKTLKQHFVERVDYSIGTTDSGNKEVKVHSERLKKAWQNWWDKKHPHGEADKFADAFLFLVTNGKVKSWNDRDPARQWKNTTEQRQKFIAENNPPQFYQVGINREKEKYADWIKQQPSLTEAELKALNDPVLKGLSELNRAFWWIQKVRQTNSDIFSDKHFAWNENFEKELDNPQSDDYKAVQALKNAGISLDKLFERVKKGRQVRLDKRGKKQQDYKEKISANLDDWNLFCNGIYNDKKKIVIESRGKSIVRMDLSSEKIDTESLPTPEVYQEIRRAIFNNFCEKFRNQPHQKKSLKKPNGEMYKKEDFSDQEWAEIEKEIGNFSTSESHQKPQNNPANRHDLIIIISLIGLLILLIGLLIIKKRPKKNDSKK